MGNTIYIIGFHSPPAYFSNTFDASISLGEFRFSFPFLCCYFIETNFPGILITLSKNFPNFLLVLVVYHFENIQPFCILRRKKKWLLLVLIFLKAHIRGFAGGLVVKNLPASAGDIGLIPGLGRSHMCRAAEPLAPQQ